MSAPRGKTVVVLDFGSQYTQLIARRVRELGVYSEIRSHLSTAGELSGREVGAIILSGGPASADSEGAPRLACDVFSLGKPVLGICYGMQLMALDLGGSLGRGSGREYGRSSVSVKRPGGLFARVPRRSLAWMSHGDHVELMPSGFAALASTRDLKNAAMGDARRKLYGVQFHPEVAHTVHGARILSNFVHGVAGLESKWTPRAMLDAAVDQVRSAVGDGGVICALSGGVDSAVAAAICARAVGDRVLCVHVDNGLLREGESEEVRRVFTDVVPVPLEVVDASERFLSALSGVSDPERKRRVIGEAFIREFEDVARKHGGYGFLAQGTLYPDVIESSSPFAGPSATIKTHHNVGGLPERMELQLVEPLRFLFKDEVRALGRELGLPESLVGRHPFPGPGLAVRVIGPVARERLEILRRADAIFTSELRSRGLYGKVAQSFAVLLPVRSVGVQGDSRTYGEVIVLRSVNTSDFMTADWSRLPAAFLARVATRIANEVHGINRVVYDVTSKPPATVEWE